MTMKHPESEEWMGYLYGEADPAQVKAMESHLGSCPECSAKVREWRATMSGLDDWILPAQAGRSTTGKAKLGWRPVIQWAAAAGVVFALGLGVGRGLSPGRMDVSKLQGEMIATMEPVLRERIRAEVAQDYRALMAQNVAAWTTARQEDQETYLAMLQRLDQQRRADDAALRKDLETVAVVAEDRLLSTQVKLGQLVSYARSGSGRSGGLDDGYSNSNLNKQ